MMRASSGMTAIRYFGPLDKLDDASRSALVDRSTSVDAEIRAATSTIIADVRARGDVALRNLAARFDHVSLNSLEVPRTVWQKALDAIDLPLRRAMERAASNIEAVHGALVPTLVETSPEPGIVIGRRPDPLMRVGVYAPGGRAVYPSSVLMGVVPARVAGVREVIVASPPGPDGLPASAVLAAAALAGADRVFAIGGAGAIAALALGTQSVPRVDRIVGPGNAYVAEAKLQVSGMVSIDSPAGPSELLIIADAAASPQVLARELVAQAEHDPRACVVAVVEGESLAMRVRSALNDLLTTQKRRQTIEAALAGQGAILWVNVLADAVDWNTAYAPEHLLVCVRNVDALLPQLRNAGTIFLGEHASVSFGDYMTGANHVLPTGGLARCYSGLSTLDFVRWTTYQRVDATAAARLAIDVGVFATAEGLSSHAAAANAWAGAT